MAGERDVFETKQTKGNFIKVFFIYQLMHKRIALKRILKFTLKQLLHRVLFAPTHALFHTTVYQSFKLY